MTELESLPSMSKEEIITNIMRTYETEDKQTLLERLNSYLQYMDEETVRTIRREMIN